MDTNAGGPDCDKHIRSQSGAALPVLAFRSNQRRQDKGDKNADREFKQVGEIDGMHGQS